jgi:ATP-binding cassette subfamily F protein 3
VKVGYYAQLQAESLDMRKTILQELEETAPQMPVAQVRAIAGAFLFSGSAVEKKCGVLSGGEKARVALAKLLLSPSNFLLLDEPTNHLDIESRGVLLEALQDYTGTLCLVSHDRSFVSPLVDTVLEIQPAEGGSRVVQLLGGYEDYLEKKLREVAQAARAPAATGDGAGAKPISRPERTGPSNNQKRAWERECVELEGEITRLDARKSELHALLGDPATYEDKARSMQLAEEQRLLDAQLSSKMTRWEEISRRLTGAED